MTFPRVHFPHISRIFSAKPFSRVGSLCLWLTLFVLVSFNVFLWRTNPLAYSDKIFKIFTHPFSALSHEELAQALRDSGARTRAQQELAIASEISPVLGANTTAQTARDTAASAYWQNILTRYPDYRDAYVQLAVLLYRRGNLTQAHAYVLQAQALDPNNDTVNRLAAFTSKLSQ